MQRRMALSAVLLVVALGICASGGHAAVNVTWQTTDGDPETIDGNWEDPTNWLTDEVPPQQRLPVAGENVNITNGATVLISDTTVIPDGASSADWLRTWNVSGNSTVLQTGGTKPATTNSFWIGSGNSPGTYRLEGGVYEGQIDLSGKNAGNQTGTFIQTGGTVDATTLRMNYKGNKSFSYYNMENGEFNANYIRMAYDLGEATMTAIITQTGGTMTIANDIKMGTKAGDGSIAPGEASVHLDGGEMTIKGNSPFIFAQPGEPVYVEFDGGALNLKGTWDFAALSGIADSDFRVAGDPASESNLLFEPVTLFDTDYTRISGLIDTGTPGDINGDGVVDAADYIVLKQNFGTGSGADKAHGDLTGEGAVDALDLAELAAVMNPAAGSAVPEPTTICLLAFGAAAVLKRRRA